MDEIRCLDSVVLGQLSWDGGRRGQDRQPQAHPSLADVPWKSPVLSTTGQNVKALSATNSRNQYLTMYGSIIPYWAGSRWNRIGARRVRDEVLARIGEDQDFADSQAFAQF